LRRSIEFIGQRESDNKRGGDQRRTSSGRALAAGLVTPLVGWIYSEFGLAHMFKGYFNPEKYTI